MPRARFLAAVVLAACGDASPPGFSTGPAITSVSASTSGSASTGETSSTGPADESVGNSASTSTSTTAGTLDVGTVMDFGPAQPPGCKGKVDLLFVISRVGSMVSEQEQLLASFPGFINTIEEKLEGFDVHIMTANPDAYWPGWTCESKACVGEESWPNCGKNAEDYICGTFAEMMTPCDEELGAGLIFNAGGYAANKLCELQGGNRYIVSGQPDMPDAFECIAKVGASGGAPFLGDAMIAALSDKLNGPSGCNEGFLREDALLVVVFVSDKKDFSKTHAKAQYEAILAAKGDPSAVVMLSVENYLLEEGEPYPPPSCAYNASGAHIFEDLFSKFPYHAFGDTCAPSYAPFFDTAVDKISEACGSFIPQ